MISIKNRVLKKTHLFIWGAILMWAVSAVLMESNFRKKEKVNFEQFYSTDIHGPIKELYEGGSGVHLSVEGCDIEFVFSYYPDKYLNRNEVFSYIAKQGDTVIKPAFSDTINLVINNEVLRYVVKRY